MEYALAFHGLIPERVETITSVTPKKDKQFDTPLGRFTYRYLALEKYAAGIEQIWVDHNHPVLMATIEKALCDYIVLNKVPSLNGYREARDFLESDLRIDQEHWERSEVNPAILSMLERYKCVSANDYENALKEIMQEIALLGLWRAKFFEHAAFYGGTALRVLYELDRFSCAPEPS